MEVTFFISPSSVLGRQSLINHNTKMFHTVVRLSTVFLVIVLMCTNLSCEKLKNSKSRGKRWLIFPRASPTRTQVIAGIGIPVQDLAYESVTTGYVFKAEYFLPYSMQQFFNFTPQNIGNIPFPSRKRRGAASPKADDLIGYVDETDEDGYTESLLSKQSMNKLRGAHNDLDKYRWSLYKGIEIFANK